MNKHQKYLLCLPIKEFYYGKFKFDHEFVCLNRWCGSHWRDSDVEGHGAGWGMDASPPGAVCQGDTLMWGGGGGQSSQEDR